MELCGFPTLKKHNVASVDGARVVNINPHERHELLMLLLFPCIYKCCPVRAVLLSKAILSASEGDTETSFIQKPQGNLFIKCSIMVFVRLLLKVPYAK